MEVGPPISGPGKVLGTATGYGLEGPGIEYRWGQDFSVPVQTGPGAHPASCTMGSGSFPGIKSGQGMRLTPHPLLVPWSKKGTAIPLLPLWAVRPVQSLSASTRVHFTFFNSTHYPNCNFNPLNAELNPICYMLTLLGAHHFLYVSWIRVKSLTLRLLISYIYIYIWSTYS